MNISLFKKLGFAIILLQGAHIFAMDRSIDKVAQNESEQRQTMEPPMTESDVIKFIVPVFAAVGTPFVCFAGSGLYSLISLFKGNSIFNAGTYGCIVIPPLTYYIASRYGEAIALRWVRYCVTQKSDRDAQLHSS